MNSEAAEKKYAPPKADQAKGKANNVQSFEDKNSPNEVFITHPRCYRCHSLMILLNVGKVCPECGHIAYASKEWVKAHSKYSGVV